MSLLLQLSADLRTRFPQDERRLHLFCCRERKCVRKVGNIRAVRETRRAGGTAVRGDGKAGVVKTAKEQETEGDDKSEKVKARDLGGMLFGVSSPTSTPTSSAQGANPFSAKGSTTSGAGQSVNPFSSIAPTSSLAAKPAQLPDTESIQPPTDTFASKLKISSNDGPSPQPKPVSQPPAPHSPWPPNSSFPTPYPIIPLDSDSEIIYPSDTTNFKARSSGPSKTRYDEEDMDLDNPTSDGHARKSSNKDNDKDKDTEKELFESSMDTTFQRFCDRLSHNPLQVLRYEFGGTPLLYADNDAVAGYFTKHTGTATKGGKIQTQSWSKELPRCENCGAKRVFEVQLVPGAISALEDDDDTIGVDEGMEWGTVIMGVCEDNCADAGQVVFREEWVGVQWEERVVRAK